MCTRRITGLLIMVCLGPAVGYCRGGQEGKNLIDNGSFERVKDDKPVGWETRNWSGNGRFDRVGTGRTGKASVMISSRAGADISWSQSVAVKPNTRYRLSGWIRTEELKPGSGRGALLNVHNVQSARTQAIKGTADWQQVSVVFNSGVNNDILVNCLFGGWGRSTGKAWYDDITLVELSDKPLMFYADDSNGRPYAKDPDVVRFKGTYYMYYTMRWSDRGRAVGIATSKDLTNWTKAGEILPEEEYEKNGLAAPAAIVLAGKIHLFYQIYGNGPKDAICHAVSTDGIHFTRDKTNPVFRPTGEWNCGRAIDADVIEHDGKLLLYWATRDPAYRVQMVGVSSAPLDSDYGRDKWKQLCDGPILKPKLPWEKSCIEAPSVVKHGGRLFMFYAGAYNNQPQQIGCAVSDDGISWQRLSEYPLLPNGAEGRWNSSESGHPGVFVDDDGSMHLFFQGNNDRGKTWHLSRMSIGWKDNEPYLVRPGDGREFHLRKTIQSKVTIDATRTSEPISKYIYGQFIEHLGRCIYGGIWAEMLEDRKFYYKVPADGPIWTRTGAGARVLARSPWKVVGRRDCVSMVKEGSYVGDWTPQISLPGDGTPAGIAQGELGLVKGREYVGRVVVAGDSKAAPIRVSLIWGKAPGDRHTVVIDSITGEFRKYPFMLKAGASTDEGILEITASGKGRFSIGAVSLMPGDNIRGWRKDTVDLMRALKSPVYRWPGGNFVSGYNWKDGIGDIDKRPPRKNPAWTGIEHNDVGIDEYIFLCSLLKAEPFITVNTGLGSAEMAAEEVEYANGSVDTPMGKWRAKNGYPQPYNVKWWAVGNEMYGSWQLGHMPLEEYVKKHNKVVEAMRAVDPDIRLVAVGAVGRWSEQMMTHCADHMDLISEHFYTRNRDDLLEHVRQIPNNVRRIADAHRDYRRRIASLKGKDIRIALDEWNYWYGPHIYGELGTRYFMQDALGIAAGLHEYFRNSDMIFMANYAQTVNVIGCIKTTKTAAAFAATGLPLWLYRNHFGVVPVAVSGDYGDLDVVCAWTEDKKTLTLGIVNATTQKHSISLDVKGADVSGGAIMYVIEHKDRMAYNEPGKKPQIAIKRYAVIDTGKIVSPPISIALFRLPVKQMPQGEPRRSREK